MTSLDSPASASRSIASVLLVEPETRELHHLVETLSNSAVRLTAVQTFAEAKPLIGTSPPDILITALRLGMYNGLHLVLRGKGVRPDMAALVTSTVADPVLQADADALGATFVVKPISEQELVAAVLRTVHRDAAVGPIRPPFERRLRERRVREPEAFAPDRRNSDRRRPALWQPVEGRRP